MHHEDAARLLRWRHRERVEFELVLGDVHDDVAKCVHRAAVDRLEADRDERVREPVTERAGVPFALVELDRVVVRRLDVVPVEVVAPGAGLLDLHRVTEADDLVVTHDVAVPLDVDAVIAPRVGSASVGVDEGPRQAALEHVVGDVGVLLVRIAVDTDRDVTEVQTTGDVALRAGGLEPEPAERVLEGQALAWSARRRRALRRGEARGAAATEGPVTVAAGDGGSLLRRV